MLPDNQTSVTRFNAIDFAEYFQESVDYRKNKFDADWKQVAQYAEANRGKSNNDGYLENLYYEVNIPHVKLNTERKVAAMSGTTFFPVLESDAADLPNHQTVQQMVLRWAWRQAKADAVLVSMLRDFFDFGISVAQVYQNEFALDGKGAPAAVKKDITNIYVDPNRRDADPNVDARWIMEVQCITVDQAKAFYPHYFDDSYAGSAAYKAGNYSSDRIYSDEQKVNERKGYVDLVRVEFVAYIGRKKRVYHAILDIGKKAWVIPPEDNNLGRYSYFFMSAPLKRGASYPEVPTLAEHALSDLINDSLSIYVDDAARTAAPDQWIHSADVSAERSLRDPNGNKPGAIKKFDIAPAEYRSSPRATKAIDIAETMDAKLQLVGMMPGVMMGNAPQGVRSGRAIRELKESASGPMKSYSIAYYDAAVQLATCLFAECKAYVNGARFLTIKDDQTQFVVPVNIAEDSQERTRLENMQIPDNLRAETARVTVGGQTRVVPREEAAAIQAENPDATVVLSLNDIQYGNAEVSCEVKLEMSPQDKAIIAQGLMGQGIMGPHYGLKAMGWPNPEQIIAEADARNADLQLAQMVKNDPLLMAQITQPEIRRVAATIIEPIIEQANKQKTESKKNADSK